MADIYQPEDLIANVYKWAEKEISDSVVDDIISTFSFSQTVVNALGIGLTPLPDYKDGDNYAMRDVVVYYRKNGVDTKVDETDISTVTGTTLVFVASIATETADSIVMSYPYALSGDKTSFTCSIKDFDKSGGESDSEVENTIGGCSYKKKLPPGLVEISFTAIKNGIRLSEAVNGDIIKTTTEVSGKTIRTTSQASNRTPRMIVLRARDPVNTTVELFSVARNVDGVTADHSGGADASWEESVNFKTDQQNYGEVEVE